MDYDLLALTPRVTLIGTNITSTTPTNGTGQDFKGFQGKLLVTLASSGVVESTGTLNVKIQDSTNNSTWADVSGGAFTATTNVGSTQQIAIDTRATNRYLRAIGTIGGNNTPAFGYGVFANGMLKYNPDGGQS